MFGKPTKPKNEVKITLVTKDNARFIIPVKDDRRPIPLPPNTYTHIIVEDVKSVAPPFLSVDGLPDDLGEDGSAIP